jgi:pSer/pThr/pTyr-binding forkhead associated (FHA) protein
MGLKLVVCHRGRPDWNAGEFSYELDQARVVVGRSKGADVRLPDRTVSEVHATLERSTDGFSIRDEGSTNGTWVNGVQLAVGRARLLSSGDAIQVGDFVVNVELGPTFATMPRERTASLAKRMLRELLDSSDPLREPPRILMTQGAQAGVSLKLGAPPSIVRIGPEDDCEIRTDPEQRGQVEIKRDHDGALARTLHGGALVVNGRSVNERRLKHGDVIALGSYAFTFEDPAELALQGLEAQSDVPVTRTALLPKTAEAKAAPEPTLETPKFAEKPAISNVERMVYALALLILAASLGGLLWLFT